MAHEHYNPADVISPTVYSHVTVTEGSRIAFIAGQVALDSSGQVVGEGDLARQVEQAFRNLEVCLASIGATFADVAKLNTYTVNYKPEDSVVLREVRSRFLISDSLPAVTGIGVQALARPSLLFEVDAVVVLPRKSASR